jgi:hypothetical protein
VSDDVSEHFGRYSTYPLTSPLTDGWGALGDALKAVRAFASDDLIADEPAEVERLIAAVDHVVSVRLS